MSDEHISLGEQAAFSEAYDLIARLTTETGFHPTDIGKGLLVAALCCLRKELLNSEIAKLFYEVADDYAVRHIGFE